MRAGVLYSDYFSNAVYGGWRKSLLAGRRFRDGLLTRIPPDTRVRRRVPKGARSETGIPGVTLERYRVDGREYERFVASWQNADGECQRRRFSVGRYGKEVAEALATAERNKGVETARREKQARQREEAERRLLELPPEPCQVKDPLTRKGIKMPPRPRNGRTTGPNDHLSP